MGWNLFHSPNPTCITLGGKHTLKNTPVTEKVAQEKSQLTVTTFEFNFVRLMMKCGNPFLE
jgi:hypothetical protein